MLKQRIIESIVTHKILVMMIVAGAGIVPGAAIIVHIASSPNSHSASTVQPAKVTKAAAGPRGAKSSAGNQDTQKPDNHSKGSGSSATGSKKTTAASSKVSVSGGSGNGSSSSGSSSTGSGGSTSSGSFRRGNYAHSSIWSLCFRHSLYQCIHNL